MAHYAYTILQDIPELYYDTIKIRIETTKDPRVWCMMIYYCGILLVKAAVLTGI